jgi:hypothetical protein
MKSRRGQPRGDDIVCHTCDLTHRRRFHYGTQGKKGGEGVDPRLLSRIHSKASKHGAGSLPDSGEHDQADLLFRRLRERGMGHADQFSEDELARIEREHPEGLSSEEIVGAFSRKGVKFTEAALRKYVQLGLLPRSVRVGLKGKHRGSQGMYPSTVVRRIQRLKAMMSEFTIEQIQREFLFVRGDVEELERTLERIFSAFASVVKSGRGGDVAARAVQKELGEARSLAAELVARITGVETRLTMQARLQREAM